MTRLELAVPDLVSNSYFPAIAAAELGCFAQQGLDVRCRHVFPVNRCLELLRDGEIQFVAGAAHAAPQVFPRWEGVRLLAALAQHMYWLLIVRADLGARRGELGVLKGLRIGAAPLVEQGLRALLAACGLEPGRDRITIAPVPGAAGPGVSFGVQAARALEAGELDAFWANGLGAEVAVRRGVGTLLLDVRRGDGPDSVRNITFPALMTTDRLAREQPEVAAAATQAVRDAQSALRSDVSLATRVGQALFPAYEATLIADVVARDLPYYDAGIRPEVLLEVERFVGTLRLS